MKKLILAILLLAASGLAQRSDVGSVAGTPAVGDAAIFDGTQFNFQNPPMNGTSNVNRLTGGCGVTWTTGLSFVVAPCTYSITGITYTSVLTTVTLTAADGSNPRIDAIIVDNTGVATKVTGTPAASPAAPSIDPTTQLLLVLVTVKTSATTPFGVFLENAYLENTEWTCAASDGSNNCASTNNPFAGTKDIEGTTAARGDNVTLTRSSSLILSNYNNLSFYIRSKAAWANNCNMTWMWQLGGVQQGTGVVLSNGAFAFTSSQVATYQLIVIPITAFGSIGQADRLTFTVTGAGSCSLGYYIDNIILQGGISAPQAITGLYPIVVASNGVISCPTCSTGGINNSTVGGIIGGQAGGNITPFHILNVTTGRFVPFVNQYASGPALTYSAGLTSDAGSLAFYGQVLATFNIANQSLVMARAWTNYFGASGSVQQVNEVFPWYTGMALIGNTYSYGTDRTIYWSSSLTGSNSCPMGSTIANTVALGATVYTAPGQGAVNAASTTDEQLVELPIPAALDIYDSRIVMSTSNGAGGSFTGTLRKNESATAQVVSVAASQGAGLNLGNASHISYAAGDKFSFQIVNNNGAAATGAIQTVVHDIRPTAAGMTALLVFPKGNKAITASQTRYMPLFINVALNATEALAEAPLPRAGVMRNLYCYQKTAPAATTTVTVYKNGTPTTLTIALTAAAGNNVVLSDTTHAVAFNALDTTSIEWVSGAGAVGVWSGCTAEFD